MLLTDSRKFPKIHQTLMSTATQSVINWSFDDNSKLYFGFCLSFRSTVKRTIVSFLCFTWKFRNVTHCTQFELCTFVVQRFSFILKAIISKNRRTRTTQRGHEVRCPLLTSHCSYLRRQRLRGRRWRLEKKKGYIVISTVISKSSSVFPTNDFSRISAAKVSWWCFRWGLIWKLRIWGN